ncbi:uncharacterized protein [Drosophila virilis]|uniref:Uncharacterized protein n=1 Tax=Drosophila virilis TaxID=7244 RepID=B4M113_DROVI|nr:circadian clock-controlled protein [Drosophila virilis]EDW67424.1 uncharacterized protein Dvir_GJ23083 [Drosophila virilis]
MNNIQIFNFLGLLLVSMLATLAVASNYLAEKPNFLTPCVLEDPNFNKCLATNLQGIFVQWKDGIPGTNTVGSMDPLFLKRVKFTQDANNAIALNADLQNVNVIGSSQLTIKEANYSPSKYVAKALIFVPKLRFEFDYKVKGHVLALNLNGQGKGYFESENVVVGLEIAVKARSAPEGTFADVQRVKVYFREIGSFHIKLKNLFGNNAELDRTAHTLFNENWRQFYDVLRPAIEQTFETVLLDRTKKIFAYVPATYFIHNFH